MWIQVCIGHSGVYRGHYRPRDVKGRLFVSYNFGALQVYDRLDIYNSC